MAEKARDRLARKAAARKIIEAHRLIRGQKPARRRDHAGKIETYRRADQNPGVEFGRIDVACPKPGCQRAPRGLNGLSGEGICGAHAAAPWAASCAA